MKWLAIGINALLVGLAITLVTYFVVFIVFNMTIGYLFWLVLPILQYPITIILTIIAGLGGLILVGVQLVKRNLDTSAHIFIAIIGVYTSIYFFLLIKYVLA